MANEIQATYDTGFTLYALIFNAAGQIWQLTSNTFVAYVAANIDNYDIVMPEIATNSGEYRGVFDADIVTGTYSVILFEQAGGGPVVADDERIGVTGEMNWDGSAEINHRTISNQIVDASPQNHSADSSTDTTGTIDAGNFAATATIGGAPQYWQISPVTPAVGGFGLSVYLEFDIGTGLDRVPVSVNIAGYFDANPTRDVRVWAYNFLTTAWEEISDSGSAIANGSSNSNYQYVLHNDHVQTSDGKIRIRFTSTSTTVGDDLFLDYVSVGSIAVEAAGLSPESIAQAVHAHNVAVHTDHNSAGFRIAMSIIDEYPITTSDTALSFTCSSLPAITNYYQAHRVRVHDVTNTRYACSWIESMDNSGVVILGRVLPFIPDTSAEMYVMESVVTPAQIQAEVEGGGSTLETIAADVATMLLRLTAVRAGYLDELAAANIPADIDSLLTRLSAVRAGYLDELGPTNIPTDVDTLLARLTALRAGYLEELAAANIPADIDAILAKTNLITSGGRVTIISPVSDDEEITIVQGDDYLVANGTNLAWTSETWTSPSLASATAKLRFVTKEDYDDGVQAAALEVDVTITWAGSGNDAVFTADLTAAETTALSNPTPPNDKYSYVYQLQVTTDVGKKITVALGSVYVKQEIL